MKAVLVYLGQNNVYAFGQAWITQVVRTPPPETSISQIARGRRQLTWHSRQERLWIGEEWRSCWSPRMLAGSSPTFDDVNTQLQTKFSQEPESIDWEYYRKGTGSRLVDMYKQAYDENKIPKYVDNVTPQYKPKFDAPLVELKETVEKSLKESERLEREILEFQELKKKLSTMTADEYFENNPELRKKFDEMRND